MMLPRRRVCLYFMALISPWLMRGQALDPDFKPAPDSYVYAVVAQPQLGGRLVVGGAYTRLAGRIRSFIGRLNADGSFDDTFSTSSNGVVQCIVAQPDGKLLLGGQFSTINGQPRSRLARLNADGTLDLTFSPAATVSGLVRKIVLQPDGRILVAGDFDTVAGQSRTAIARFNADGALDAGFRADATGLLLPGAAPGIFALALQPDGKILFGGQFVFVSGETRNGLARVNADGSLDAGFNPSPRPADFQAIAVLPDGRILVGGGFSQLAGRAQSYLARLNGDGSADPGFAFTGNSGVASIFPQPDGRILVSGYFTQVSGQPHAGWVRLASFGAADASFNFDLVATNRQVNSPVSAVVPLPDGGMIWAGNFNAVGGFEVSNIVRIAAAPAASRLANLSARGFVAVGGDLAVGFGISGTGKSLLLRGVGPTLGGFGVAGSLVAPRLEVIPAGTTVATAANTGWGGDQSLAAAFGSVGAFALPAGSADAALLASANGGTMTARVTSATAGGSGIALAEIYDRDTGGPVGRLVNLSTLGFVGSGAQALVPGFVITGAAEKLLLIRAVGPGLAPFNVTGALADPVISVIAQGAGATVAANDNWGGDVSLTAAFAAAGAFTLPPASRDAAVLVRLLPGAYTVVVSGSGNTTGRALVEIYDLDP
jgi:uncharacterized delta-60 repeat protein